MKVPNNSLKGGNLPATAIRQVAVAGYSRTLRNPRGQLHTASAKEDPACLRISAFPICSPT